ncbi:hypothetical protein JCM11641_001726 [Rhodosporidiobolus odoratus]
MQSPFPSQSSPPPLPQFAQSPAYHPLQTAQSPAHRPSPRALVSAAQPQPSSLSVPTGPRSLRANTSTRGPAAGLQVQDPQVEARRAVGVVLGAQAGSALGDGAEGLLDRVESEVMALLDTYEGAFEQGGKNIDPTHSLDSLTALLSLLSRSSLGGFVPSASTSSSVDSAALPPPELGQFHLDAANQRVQELFKEVQRGRERAEVVRVGLLG